MNLLFTFVFAVYCAIGITFNGIMNEEGQSFSFILMLFWPIVLVFLAIGGIFTVLIGIGTKIKEKLL